MKHSFIIFSAAVLFSGVLNAQGLVINEISQGPSGSKEFIELLVVGSNTQKTGTLDISNWIIDDNNGDFKLSDNSAPGIATGHFRFTSNDTTLNMPIGSLIVLYNAGDKDPTWTFPIQGGGGEDEAYFVVNSAGTITYYVPGTSTLLRAVSLTPSSSSTSYTYTKSTIAPTKLNWNGELGLANNGDAIQTRKPDGTFFQGFGFSTPTQSNLFTQFPSAVEPGLPSFNAFAGVAGGKVTYFTCGSWYFAPPYHTDAVSAATPGEPNNSNNAALVAKIAGGTFNYSLLGSDISCAEALPIMLSSLIGRVKDNNIIVSWTMTTEMNNDYFLVEHSLDQHNWHVVSKIKSKGNSTTKQGYTYTDYSPSVGLSYYRIVQVNLSGKKLNSNAVAIQLGKQGLATKVYPNPIVGNNFNLRIGNKNVDNVVIVNVAGKVMFKKDKIHNQEVLKISVAGWAKGVYFAKLSTKNGDQQTIKLLRE